MSAEPFPIETACLLEVLRADRTHEGAVFFVEEPSNDSRAAIWRTAGRYLNLRRFNGAYVWPQPATRGLRTIPIGDIVGSQDRCCDFDRCFHPLRDHLAGGVSAVARVFPSGDFPPIDVARVDRAYFVIDGHKRVAAARALGVEFIDAHVTQYASRQRLDSSIGPSDLDLLESAERFLTETGLQRVRPGADLRCLTPGSYAELLEAVKAHGHDLMRAAEQLVPREEVAAHWHDCDFVPTLAAARDAGVAARLACCPPGELYLVLHRHVRGLAGTSCIELDRAATSGAVAAASVGARRRFRRRPSPG